MIERSFGLESSWGRTDFSARCVFNIAKANTGCQQSVDSELSHSKSSTAATTSTLSLSAGKSINSSSIIIFIIFIILIIIISMRHSHDVVILSWFPFAARRHITSPSGMRVSFIKHVFWCSQDTFSDAEPNAFVWVLLNCLCLNSVSSCCSFAAEFWKAPLGND